MDTSKTYIKMRLAARRYLLDGIPPLINCDEPFWVNDCVFIDRKGDFYYSIKDETCQLEREDQLQDMCGFNCAGNAVANMADFAYFNSYETMAQLLLAFVLKDRYNKKWDSRKEKWIKS